MQAAPPGLINEIRIRAFRAIDDPATCEKFIEGHKNVLECHGILKVTSSNDKWSENPAVFVIVVETMNGEKLYGGARLHAADGKTRLPIEDATGDMDNKIHDIVAICAQHGTGELCGLWNSKEVAGLGIGSLFPSIAAVVIAEQIGLTSMFSLCSPATVRFNQWIGSAILKTVGNDGTFYYPKLDLLATAVFLSDAASLSKAHPKEKKRMLYLRKNLCSIGIEKSPFKDSYVKVHYELEINGADKAEFKIYLESKTGVYE